ncbi:MAG: hypothetical protein ABMA64_10250 [Myxococcota bacterium]
MIRMNAMALLLAVAPACVVYDVDPHPHGGGGSTVVVTNAPPYVVSADAWVYYDPAYGDDIWAFEAMVDDPNGVYDVIGVWADVYDEYAGGVLVESFELYPTNDPYVWYSDWLGSTTYLDPFWPGYTVDFVVYDAYDDFGWTTVWADTY